MYVCVCVCVCVLSYSFPHVVENIEKCSPILLLLSSSFSFIFSPYLSITIVIAAHQAIENILIICSVCVSYDLVG